jgi:DNA-binding winged helix-turn-helix (wHTH) protein
VTVQISALRHVLDEGRSGPSLIQTVPGRGYRFVAPVIRGEAEPRLEVGRDENRAEDELTSPSVIPASIAPIAATLRRRAAVLAVAAAFLAVLVLVAGAWRLWVIEKTAAVRGSQPPRQSHP